MADLNARVREWTDRLRSRAALRAEDVVELENHLREEIERLGKAGLTEEEVFLVAEHRVGSPETLAREYAKVHEGTPWRGLPFDALTDGDRRSLRRELGVVVLLALAAVGLSEIPRIFGARLLSGDGKNVFLENLALFFMPVVAVYYAIRSRPRAGLAAVVAALFALGALTINLYPWTPPPQGQTLMLAFLHLPVMLWLVVGLAFAGSRWRECQARMDFLRTTGEAVIYGTLILCGGVVLSAFTMVIFSALGLDIQQPYTEHVALGGAVAAPVVAVFLVNAKKSIVENIAPVLSRIFSPLVLLTLAAFLVALGVLGRSPLTDRDTLLAFNVMLILVLALVIYNLSARRSAERRELADWLNLALVACAVAIDGIALVSIVGRILSFGWSPNRVALFGENIVLLVDLGGLAWLTFRFVVGRGRFQAIERWQTGYLPVLFGWSALVVAALPPLFAFA